MCIFKSKINDGMYIYNKVNNNNNNNYTVTSIDFNPQNGVGV